MTIILRAIIVIWFARRPICKSWNLTINPFEDPFFCDIV